MITQPANIQLIAIDIDGTLLTPQKTISSRTREAIQAAQEAGIIVTLATARRYENSKHFADELGIDIPLITCDGALIIDHPAADVLHTQLLEAHIAQQAVDILIEYDLQPIIHHIDGTMEQTWSGLAEFDNPELAGYFQEFPRVHRLTHAQLCLGQPDPIRVVSFASEEAIARVAPFVAQLPCAWNTIKRGNYGTAEITIMHADCSKATGVLRLAHHLNIPLANVMALGDNNNDREMIKAAGWGVAMGQAPAEVKAIANAVTTTNLEDGVAVAIERYALGSERARNEASNSLNRATCL
ncbi:Cof-type HAD-IIB family hydrolase [Dictyobacter arantiisoli]|uniref:Haloacid dehalogenase n=1 Tax=Dictyobacter arantiisoli TaxID=2014874 RepID=A0A5A5TH33_9CHLR|nr:Cof-type HAD-IIB family hydrolase [Dictyobacter arantiisoli]GCF10274.1 haloacid dehalogenase [Dictyobacter arantiisoli]